MDQQPQQSKAQRCDVVGQAKKAEATQTPRPPTAAPASLSEGVRVAVQATQRARARHSNGIKEPKETKVKQHKTKQSSPRGTTARGPAGSSSRSSAPCSPSPSPFTREVREIIRRAEEAEKKEHEEKKKMEKNAEEVKKPPDVALLRSQFQQVVADQQGGQDPPTPLAGTVSKAASKATPPARRAPRQAFLPPTPGVQAKKAPKPPWVMKEDKEKAKRATPAPPSAEDQRKAKEAVEMLECAVRTWGGWQLGWWHPEIRAWVPTVGPPAPPRQ